jgi:asparagine synthase (glutamine-hydrolysing)
MGDGNSRTSDERMTGVHGAIGHELPGTAGPRSSRYGVSSYADGGLSIRLVTHPLLGDEQPVEVGEDVRVWVLGEVYGFDDTAVDGSSGHRPRPKDVDSATYCAGLYASHGLEFAGRLNGNCVVLVHDEGADELLIVTDRLGTIPIYHARTDDGVAFSTDIENVARRPEVETEFELGYLHEYLVYRRTFGVKTPLAGIEELPPASVSTIDLEDGSIDVERYWRPRFRPRDVSFETFADEFTRTFKRVIDEWRRDDLRYGVLLSGGSDSRLNLAALGSDVTAFHMADWMSREARTAERVAIESGNEFVFLKRDPDYQSDSLQRNRAFSNFNGWFTQGYASGFEEEITDRVDVLLSGMYADTLFKGHAIPSPSCSLGPVGNLTLPLESSIDSLPEFVDWLLESAPSDDNLPLSTDLRTVIEENVYRDGDEIVHHGVRYDSLEDLVYAGGYFPLTNDDDVIFRNSLRGMLPYRTPFLDNRLVELSLRMPIRYRLRRNVINAAIERLDPELASIPHAHTGLGLDHSFAVDYLGRTFYALWRKHVVRESPPRSHLSNGSWVNDAELIRTDDFYWEAIEAHADLIDELPFVEFENVRDCYRSHLRGENNVVELYTLLTVLTMPITEELATMYTDDDRTSDHGRITPPEGSR